MSIIESILKPYKILFKGSKEQPKEVGIEESEQEDIPRPAEKPKQAETPKPEPERLDSNHRAGKVLWKKK